MIISKTKSFIFPFLVFLSPAVFVFQRGVGGEEIEGVAVDGFVFHRLLAIDGAVEVHREGHDLLTAELGALQVEHKSGLGLRDTVLEEADIPLALQIRFGFQKRCAPIC